MTSRISRVVVTPVAFADPPLLNVVGVHQSWALRAIVEVHTDSGLLGLGEGRLDRQHHPGHLAPRRNLGKGTRGFPAVGREKKRDVVDARAA